MLTVAIGCIFLQSERIFRQLDFYRRSNYGYVFEAYDSVNQNDYFYCSSVIFYGDKVERSVIAECYMLTGNSSYDDAAPFRLQKELGSRQVAVTKNLAREYGLSVGSILCSKHVCLSTVESYTVAEILPVCYGVLNVDYNLNKGCIVMGYDEVYDENMDFSHVGFSEGDPSRIIIDSNAGLISLTDKTQQQRPFMFTLLIEQLVVAVFVVALTFLYFAIHRLCQQNYYARLQMNGCPPKRFKKVLFADMFLPGAAGLLLALCFSIIAMSLYNGYASFVMPLASIAVGMFALSVMNWVCLRKRKEM